MKFSKYLFDTPLSPDEKKDGRYERTAYIRARKIDQNHLIKFKLGISTKQRHTYFGELQIEGRTIMKGDRGS